MKFRKSVWLKSTVFLKTLCSQWYKIESLIAADKVQVRRIKYSQTKTKGLYETI